MKLRYLAASSLLLLAAAATPGASAADLPSKGKDITYAVEIDGEGTYTHSVKDVGPDGWDGHDVKVTFYYKGAIGDGVVFRNGVPFDTKADDLPDGLAAGFWQQTSSNGNGPECLSNVDDPSKGWMRFVEDGDLPGSVAALDDDLHLWLRPFDAFDVGFDCPGLDQHPGVSLNTAFGEAQYEDGTPEFGLQPFDATFTIPRDVIGMGYIEQLIPLQVFEGERCPHFLGEEVETCRLEWEAKIKLTTLSEKPIDGGTTPPVQQPQTQPPPPSQPPAPPKPPAPKPDPEDDDWLVPLVPAAKASLSQTAAKASFSVSCAAGCTGTASLTAGTGAKASTAARKRPKPLARASFKLAKGQTKRVTLKLGAKARRAVKKAGGARVVVRTVAGGKATTKTLKLRLPRRR